MYSLDPNIFSVACAIERNVGEAQKPSPRPTSPRIFNPYSQFQTAHSATVSLPKRPVTSPPHSVDIKVSSHASVQNRSILPSLDFIPSPSEAFPPHTSLSYSPPPKAAPSNPFPIASSSSSLILSSSNAGRTIIPRKPRAGREIIPSPLRPHVAAADRLFLWETPFALEHRAHLHSLLPSSLVDPVLMTIRGALAPGTKSSYAAGLLRWTQFCDKHAIPEESRMPASYALICGFIAEHKGLQSGGTIKGWLSGIRSWHLVNHAPWYGEDDPWVDFARATATKEGAKHKRPLRSPVSIEHLLFLRNAITLSDPFHAAVWAVALCTFWGCRRLGETTIAVEASFDASYHVLRSTSYVCLPIFT
jgi:hypothetical protein